MEALLTPDNVTDSASDGIDGGTGCNFIFLIYAIAVVDYNGQTGFIVLGLTITPVVIKWVILDNKILRAPR